MVLGPLKHLHALNMTGIAFAVPPASLLPASENGATPLHKPAAGREGGVARSESVRAEPTLEVANSDDVLEVQLSDRCEHGLRDMTVKQLRALAVERSVSIQGLSSKKQILAKLLAQD